MSIGRRLGALARRSSAFFLIIALVATVALATGQGSGMRLLVARAGHTSTVQLDGSLVIAGGTGARGVVRSLEFFDPVSGKSSPGPRLYEARSNHSAVALADGRILLTGGRSGDNALLASSEIYDAATGALQPGAAMTRSRANHTSTLLADGRVLLAGGDADGTAEIYDATANRFVFAGRLAVARAGHSALRLGDGRVLLVGGSGAAGATAEIFDPATNTSAAVAGGMKAARERPTLKLISDGKVQVYGGDAEITMEIYNPIGYFSSRGHLLRDSGAFRSVMYSPGQAALIAAPTANGKRYAEDALGAGAGEFERTGHTATEVAAHGTMVVVGGYGTAGTALDTITELGSCGGSVTTDLTDYHPGQTVVMSGSGWAPHEQITLNLHRDTNDPPDTVLYATADDNGDWIDADYVVQQYDLDVTFVLTATGDSGCVAQTTFTDSGTPPQVNFLTSGLPNGASVTVNYVRDSNGGGTDPLTNGCPQSPGSVTFVTPLNGSRNGNEPNSTFCFTYPATVTVGAAQYSLQSTSLASPIVLPAAGSPDTNITGTYAPSIAATATQLASSLNGSTYGQNVTFTATVTSGGNPVTVGTVTFIDGGSCLAPLTTLAANVALSAGGTAAYATAALSAGSHPIGACYSGTPAFSASAASLTQAVAKADATIHVTPYNVTYDGNAHTATATATGVNGEDLASGLNLSATTHTNVGDYTADAWSFTAPNGNYNDASGTVHDQITKADATIHVTPYNVTYDGNAHTATGTATGVNGEDLASGLNLSGTTHTNVGDYTSDAWTFTAPNGNYNDTSGTVHDQITKADATIHVTPYSVTYDGNAHTATGTATGVKGEDLSSGLDLSTTTHTNAGDYATDAWTFTAPNGNYNNASGTVHDHIAKADATISVTPYSVTYDGNAHTATGSATGVKGETLAGLNLSGTTHTNAGDYAADAWSFTDSTGNYNNASGTVHDHIAKADATISVTPYSVTYDASAHTATGSATGVKGETLAGLNLSGTTHTNAGEYPADPWTFTDVTGNYNDAGGTVHDVIAKANATILVTPYHVTYDTFAHTATGTATGVLGEALAGLNLSGTTHTNAGVYNDTWTFTDVTGNYKNASGQVTDVIDPRDALVRYIGQQTFVTSGSSSTTAQVTLSASVQDPTGAALVGARIDFIDTSTGQVMAGTVPVSAVANSPANTGTANAIVTLSTGQFGAQSYLILVRMSGNYDNTDQVAADKTAAVVVMKPAVTNQTTGGGTYAALGTAAGTYAGGGSGMPSFSVGMSYNKSGTNPKGQVIVTVPQANGVLYIKSNSISSMAITGKNSTIYTKSTVYEVLNNGSTVAIDGGVSLRLDTVDAATDQIGVTVLSSTSTLYYSNNWTLVNSAWRTAPEPLTTGSVTVD